VPLVEGPRERVNEIAKQDMGIERRPPDDLLAELVESNDPWMRACALFRIGTEHNSRLLPSVLRALSSDDALVRETALAACARLLEPGDFAGILAEQARADAFPLAQRYAQSLLGHAGAA
jgi:HEAT repeat protein